jgi:hypothetical protein
MIHIYFCLSIGFSEAHYDDSQKRKYKTISLIEVRRARQKVPPGNGHVNKVILGGGGTSANHGLYMKLL